MISQKKKRKKVYYIVKLYEMKMHKQHNTRSNLFLKILILRVKLFKLNVYRRFMCASLDIYVLKNLYVVNKLNFLFT